MQWSISPQLQALIRTFLVQYRKQLPSGEFGEWLAASSQLPPETSMFDVVFNDSGVYQVQTVATLVDDSFLGVAGPFGVDTSNLSPFSLVTASRPPIIRTTTPSPQATTSSTTQRPAAQTTSTTSSSNVQFPLLQPGQNGMFVSLRCLWHALLVCP